MIGIMITIVGDKTSKAQLFCSGKKKVRSKWIFVELTLMNGNSISRSMCVYICECTHVIHAYY